MELLEASFPVSHANEKLVRARVALDESYPGSGGYEVDPSMFGLSEVLRIEETVAEGWVIAFVPGDPPTLRVDGADPEDGMNQAEAAVGEDLSAVDNLSLRVWGY